MPSDVWNIRIGIFKLPLEPRGKFFRRRRFATICSLCPHDLSVLGMDETNEDIHIKDDPFGASVRARNGAAGAGHLVCSRV